MKEEKREDVETLREPGDGMECTMGGVPEHGTPLPPEALGRIGQQLREVYGELLAEQLPDKFIKLLENLAKAEPTK
jgi:hypothetical protein